jgi:hypothetical protein
VSKRVSGLECKKVRGKEDKELKGDRRQVADSGGSYKL